MILYFADRHLNIIGQATTHLPEGVRVIRDLKTEDVDTGVSIFECRIPFDRKTRAKVEEWAEVGNYILRSSDNENEFYNIIDSEIDTKKQEVYIYAEDDGLDLINDVAEAYEADQPYPISSYIERFAAGAGWEIGINEVEGLTKKLSWDSEQTSSARLLSIAEGFNNCELSYSFEINGLQVTKKYINIYEERGKDTGVQLRLNKEIDGIVTTKSITNLATALKATGGTPADSDTPITLLGYEYDDGDFYVDGAVLKSRKALEKWSRYLWKGDETLQSGGHIVKPFSYATTSQAVLCEKAIEKLKTICDMEVNYDVDISKFPENVKVGDRVNIVDDAGELYLSSRVLILETSVSDMTKKAVLGEHLIKKDDISQKVYDLAEQFASMAQSRVFYTWIAYADDANGTNITIDSTGKAFIGIAANRIVETVDITDPTVFSWSRIKGEEGKGVSTVDNYYLTTEKSADVTVQNPEKPEDEGWKLNSVDKLTKDKPYLWNFERTHYSDGKYTDSEPALIGNFAKDGVGISEIQEWYGLSSDENTQPAEGEWSQDLPTMTAEKRYLWNYEVIIYTDGEPVSTDPLIIGVYGDKGDQGDPGVGIDTVTEYYAKGASSETAPADSDFSTSVPVLDATNKYLWNYEVITYTGKTSTTTPKTVIGVFGADGKGISSITEYYLASSASSGVTTSTSNWSTTMQVTTDAKKYLWNYETITYTDGSTSTTAPIIIGVHGEKGDPGDSVSNVKNYYLASASSSGVTISTTGWTEAVQTPTTEKKYLWNYEEVIYTGDKTSTKTAPCIIGVYGSEGKGIKSITEHYLASASSSGVTTSTNGWTTTMQLTTVEKKYLWNYELITYSDGSTSTTTPVVIGVHGDTGPRGPQGDPGIVVSVSSVTEYYARSSSDTTEPTSWSTTVPALTSTYKYLWNYEVINYTDGKSTTTAKRVMGVYGDTGSAGKGISSITNYYLATSASSGVTTATNGWTTATQTMTSTNKYLWNYEVISYTSGNPTTTTPIIIGTYGEKGDPGSNGVPGKGISSFTNYYLASSASSGVTTDTNGWTPTMQVTDTTKKYLWNYTVTTYTDGGTTTTSPIIIGTHGATGSAGKGISSTAITYQSSASGTSTPTGTWSSTIPSVAAGSYLWTSTVITYTDGTTSTSYSIAKMGSTGSAGRGISSTAITYQASSSGTSTPTGTWNSSIPSLSAGQYLWTQTVITYTDGTTSTSYSVGMKGATGATGKGVSSTTVTYQAHTSGTSAPTGTWSSGIPSVTQGYYLWTRTIITYTDGSTSTAYSVSRIGIDGMNGTNGTNGKDGQMLYATSSTGASTTAKVATLSTGTLSSLTVGTTVTVKFTYANTAASPTLNVNNKGAKYIALKNASLSASNPYYWKAFDAITFVYDGTYWNIVDAAATRNRMTSEGLIIGDYSGTTLGSNVLIRSNDVQIRNGTTVYATYGANKIELGKNSSTSVIDLCNGTATMQLNTTASNSELFQMSVPAGSLGFASTDKIYLDAYYSASVDYCMVTQTLDCREFFWQSRAVHQDTNKNYYSSSIDANAKTGIVLEAMIPDHTVRLSLLPNSDRVQIASNLEVTGTISATSGLTMGNGNAIKSTTSAGATVNMMYMGTDTYNILNVGGGTYPPSRLYLGINGATLRFYASGTTTAPYYFHPAEAEKYACGTSKYYWYGMYTKNFTQDLSDGRKKENIIPFGQSSSSTYSLRNTVDIHSEIFDRLKPVQYTHMNDNGRICYGLIAQDVIESITELGLEENELDLVHHEYYTDDETNEEKDTYSIAYTNLIAMLIHEVQKLKNRVNELENN